MNNFRDFSVWGWMNIFAVLLAALLVGNVLKKSIPRLRDSLTPTSVIGGIILIIAVAGLLVTYIYNRIVAKVLFPDYVEEQFLAMYGMLTGTASTGIILLREVDGEFKTPASDNLVYQNFPAIAFGFPMMFLATLAPTRPVLVLIIFALFFTALNIILFRSLIFKKRKSK